MALLVRPQDFFTMTYGEECQYSMDISRELGTKTVGNCAYKVFDGTGADVTGEMGGGISLNGDVFLFGVKAALMGEHRLEFIITCNEVLPDDVTPYEFYINMNVTIT